MPTGLADGLAPKEQRYPRSVREIRPNNSGSPVPGFQPKIRRVARQPSSPQGRLQNYITLTKPKLRKLRLYGARRRRPSVADSAFSERGAVRRLKTPSRRPGHDVLFRPWITTTRHSAGSARSPQSSSCSRLRLSEGCSTVRPGRDTTATPSPPTARRLPRHRSAVRSVGESRSGRCAGSFASSHNWLKRGQSPRRRWGSGAQLAYRCALAPCERTRGHRARVGARLAAAATRECSIAQRSRLATATRSGHWRRACRASDRLRSPELSAKRPCGQLQRACQSGTPTSILRCGSKAWPCRARSFRIAIHKIDYRALQHQIRVPIP